MGTMVVAIIVGVVAATVICEMHFGSEELNYLT